MNVPSTMSGFTSEVFVTVLAFSTSWMFLTIDYLIDLLKVTPCLGGGRLPLPASATDTGGAGAHAPRTLSLSRSPLRKSVDIWIEIYVRIAAKTPRHLQPSLPRHLRKDPSSTTHSGWT